MLIIFDLDGTIFQAKPIFMRVGLDTSAPDYEKLLEAAIQDYGELFPCAENVLKALHDMGHELIICSKSPMKYIELVLRATRINSFFSDYFSSSGYASKSELVREIVESKTRNAIVVGDTHGDITAASENGLPSIAAMYGYGNKKMLSNANYFANTPEEILGCLLTYLSKLQRMG